MVLEPDDSTDALRAPGTESDTTASGQTATSRPVAASGKGADSNTSG
jgi:hypothetical protein